MHIKSIGSIFLEVKLHEEVLQLTLRDARQRLNIALLSIEDVLVRGKLVPPHPAELLANVFVFLGDTRIDSTLDCFELFIGHFDELAAHFVEVDVEARADMLAPLH